eukprot:s1027_g6.t1
MYESEQVHFHFILAFGCGQRIPVLVNQQMVSVDVMQRDPKSIDEFWAALAPVGRAGPSIIQNLQRKPYWFKYARSQNVHPHLAVNGQRMVDATEPWCAGDVLRARYHVWERQHILHILAGVALQEDETFVESTSFLQIDHQLRFGNAIDEDALPLQTAFGDICMELHRQCIDACNGAADCARVEVTGGSNTALSDCCESPEQNLRSFAKWSPQQATGISENSGCQPWTWTVGSEPLQKECTNFYRSASFSVISKSQTQTELLLREGVGDNVDPYNSQEAVSAEIPPLLRKGARGNMDPRNFQEEGQQWSWLRSTGENCASDHVPQAEVNSSVPCLTESRPFPVSDELLLRDCARGNVDPCKYQEVMAQEPFLNFNDESRCDLQSFGGRASDSCHADGEDISPTSKSCISELRVLIQRLDDSSWQGFNNDFEQIPNLHPFARAACEITSLQQDGNTIHVYTDGSAAKRQAAWAFVVLNETRNKGERSFHKLGYAGAMLTDDVGPFVPNALDSEATAIIAATEFLLSRKWLSQIEIFFHYDALSAGHGAFGLQNIPNNNHDVSERQKAARMMVALLQQKAQCCRGLHVKAHSGQPWNELADSVASAIRQGWQPPCEAKLRCKELLTHPLANFAWIEAGRTDEIPGLETVLRNHPPDPDRGEGGQAGVELWLNGEALSKSFGVSFSPIKDACVWFQSSRILATTCHFGTLQIEIITIYAPQQARPAEEIRRWWSQLDQVIAKVRHGQICEKYALLLPATFEEFHVGEGFTYIGPKGHRSRIDFFAVSEICREGIKTSCVNQDIDLINGDRDHQAICLEMQMTFQSCSDDGRMGRVGLYDRSAARDNKHCRRIDLVEDLPPQPWEVDVNQHWNTFRNHLQQKSKTLFPKAKRQQRQSYFDCLTWQSLCDRKDLRLQHRALHRDINAFYLRACFGLWKQQCDESAHKHRFELHQLRLQEAVVIEARRKLDHWIRISAPTKGEHGNNGLNPS